MYINQAQIKKMILKEAESRVSKGILKRLQDEGEQLAAELIDKTKIILEIKDKKTLTDIELDMAIRMNQINVNTNPCYNIIRKGSIDRLIRDQGILRHSMKLTENLINIIENYLQSRIQKALLVRDLRGRETLLAEDLDFNV